MPSSPDSSQPVARKTTRCSRGARALIRRRAARRRRRRRRCRWPRGRRRRVAPARRAGRGPSATRARAPRQRRTAHRARARSAASDAVRTAADWRAIQGPKARRTAGRTAARCGTCRGGKRGRGCARATARLDRGDDVLAWPASERVGDGRPDEPTLTDHGGHGRGAGTERQKAAMRREHCRQQRQRPDQGGRCSEGRVSGERLQIGADAGVAEPAADELGGIAFRRRGRPSWTDLRGERFDQRHGLGSVLGASHGGDPTPVPQLASPAAKSTSPVRPREPDRARATVARWLSSSRGKAPSRSTVSADAGSDRLGGR